MVPIPKPMAQTLSLWTLALLLGLTFVNAEPTRLDRADSQVLELYLKSLSSGAPSDPEMINRLDGSSFHVLRRTMETYASLPGDTGQDIHRGFQQLLYRLSKRLLVPFAVLDLYSPEAARWLAGTATQTSKRILVFAQLHGSREGRIAAELAVRLAPEESLRFIGVSLRGPVGRGSFAISLLEAWNRRLSDSGETRPIPELKHCLQQVGRAPLQVEARQLEAQLTFLGHWEILEARYHKALRDCFAAGDSATVAAALQAQRWNPALLDLNEGALKRSVGEEAVAREVLRNYGYDLSQDHSRTLRRIWATLPPEALRLRYECLYAMAVHPTGNADIALEAIKTGDFSFYDVGLGILGKAPEESVREAISFILTKGDRGYEEALRLAAERDLRGFEGRATEIVRTTRDQIVAQTALSYLQRAPGAVRGGFLDFLTHTNSDLRLAGIQLFRCPERLSDQERNDFGVALTRAFLSDRSAGHRQEALFSLALLGDDRARGLFGKVTKDHPLEIREGRPVPEEDYWGYRFRLVALLGLALLDDTKAREELESIHQSGSPQERLDVLTVFMEIGEAPAFAFQNLTSTELRLAAGAAELIAAHGSAEQKTKMRNLFSGPLWRQLGEAGLKDYGLLEHAGVVPEHE